MAGTRFRSWLFWLADAPQPPLEIVGEAADVFVTRHSSAPNSMISLMYGLPIFGGQRPAISAEDQRTRSMPVFQRGALVLGKQHHGQHLHCSQGHVTSPWRLYSKCFYIQASETGHTYSLPIFSIIFWCHVAG